MKIEITIDDAEIKQAIADHLTLKMKGELGTGNDINPDNIYLFVKSKNNYRQKEWEPCLLLVTNKQKVEVEIDPNTQLKGGVNHSA